MHSPRETARKNGAGYLRISDVSRMVGMSATMLRTWERLGLTRPVRTESNYRLYSPEDVRLLMRIRHMRHVRGLNAPAIMERLQQEGLLRTNRNGDLKAFLSRWRKLRLQQKASLTTVARAAGISAGFLSALERGHVKASVGTLRRLARFYKVNLFDLFNDSGESSRRIVRPRERKLLEAARGVRMELLAWGNTVMEPHLFQIKPGAGSGESYSHQGEEFLFILRGHLNISLEGEEYEMRAGDSFYFESNTPHSWLNPGRSDTLVLWINTPPTF